MTEPFDLSTPQIDLLLRYLTGQVTPVEAEEVRQWVALRPEHRRTLAALEEAFAVRAPAAASTITPKSQPLPAPPSADAAWARLSDRLPDAERYAGASHALTLHQAPAPVAAARSPFARERSWLRIAAVVAITVGAGIWLWRTVAPRSDASLAGRSAVGEREYVTRPGERASFTLVDGTQVMLGVASRLRVPRDYGRTKREVALDGEAYFTVYHDPERRFLVYSAHGITEDIGTRFDVRDYAGDTTAQVVVAEGKVALQARNAAVPSSPMVLVADQLGYATADGTVLVRGGIDIGQYLAWLDGRLVLRNVPLRDALPQLSRWYDIDFQLGDSTLADTGITATLTSQPVAGALDLLALTLGIRIERSGRTATLYRQMAPRIP